MQLRTNCAACLSNNESTDWMNVDLSDSGYLVVKCPRSHTSVSLVPVHKFALLFDLAAMGFMDGYYREAVSGYYVSLERFTEFYTFVVLLKRGLTIDAVKAGWKNLSKQSERQLGAFLAIYMAEHQKHCDYLSRELIELRNNVVHKGYFPTRAEAFNFGKSIYEYILERIIELRKDYFDEISVMTSSITADQRDDAIKQYGEKNVKMLVQGLPTILNRFLVEEDPKDFGFDENLQKLKKYRPNIWRND